ncbi:MAG: tRNA pseudouridine(38-40) synthase TruA [Clostridia bacterium]|nr:tRNA pseudouridine(38-40) synthase TruA [Clostridia bacterium]
MRILLTVAYRGTNYSGWQWQENGPSIQQELEKALEKALGKFVRVTGASRTDAGVHALCQRAQFDTDMKIPPERYPFVLNRHLPPDIRVINGQQVDDLFHARFMAEKKIYTYRIHNAPVASAIRYDTTAHVPVHLDERKMHDAVQCIVGTHDFAAFVASGGSQKTTVRTLYSASVTREGEEITFTVCGNAFLYNMVRIIAGTLIYIGQGKLPPECLQQALETGSRLDLGITAPAQGLELTYVGFREECHVHP